MIFSVKDIPEHILKQDDKILLAKDIKPATESIKQINPDLLNDIWVMIKLGMQNNGIGFSATQAGIQKRIFVMESKGEYVDWFNPIWKPYINPSFYLQNKEEDIQLEGCLSVPNEEISVKRYKSIVAQYQTIVKSFTTGLLELKHITEPMSGIKARCYLHEKEHLLGISILDKISITQF